MAPLEGPAPEVGTPVAQPITTPLTQSALILVLAITPDGEGEAHELFADLTGIARTVAIRSAQGGLTMIVGVGANAWDRLFSGPRPADLHPFRAIQGDAHQAVATPGDLLFHFRAATMDLCWEAASIVMERLGGAVTVAEEIQGFKFFDQRDLLGFVDGTENPAGPAAHRAVTIGLEDASFAGGSYVVVQKYVHDIAKWNALTTEEQELVIGRRKLSNVELTEQTKPSNSHVALTTIVEADGTQRQILRENMPFGSFESGEAGTFFIGYSSTPSVIELMLERMFLGEPRGNYDRILDFSRAVSGSLFFVCTSDFLDDPPARNLTREKAATAQSS